MTALTKDSGPSPYSGGPPSDHRPWAGTYLSGKIGYLFGLSMMVDGVGCPIVSGAGWSVVNGNVTAVGTTDAGLLVTAKRKGVKLAIVDPSGNSKPLSTRITHSTTFTVVSILVATDAMGAIISTALEVADEIRRSAGKFLRVAQAGTGASAMVAAAAASIKAVEMLGMNGNYQIDASGGTVTLHPTQTFKMNQPGYGYGFLAGATAPTEGGAAFFIDDQTASSTQVSELDLQAPCTEVMTVQGGSASFYLCDLTRAN